MPLIFRPSVPPHKDFSNIHVPLFKEDFSKITPSLFTLKEGSTSSPSPSSSEGGDVTALRCSEPLRSKVGGPSKVSPDCAGWDRLAERVGDHLADATYLRLAATCLRLAEDLLISLQNGLWVNLFIGLLVGY